jgi:hypothetical protein
MKHFLQHKRPQLIFAGIVLTYLLIQITRV